MISFDDALSKLLASACPAARKRITLEQSLGSFLAEPLCAPRDLPSFDNSAVDGFGVLTADVQAAKDGKPVKLRLSGTIQAGDAGDASIASGECLKILTGAPVPAGVEAVVMREYCREENGSVEISCAAQPGENIRLRGGEFRQGAQILPAGVRVNPPVVGLLATLGYAEAMVYAKPRVGILVTGNELVKPGANLLPGQIYDSNSYALGAALQAMSINDCKFFVAVDDREQTRATLSQALEYADVVISTGGVSVGDFDYVKDCAEDLGLTTVFWRIALKPGKPVYFGVLERESGNKLVFGLPGNPVSALVTFHQLVKPALLKIMGAAISPLKPTVRLTRKLRKRPGRLEFVRGILSSSGGELSAQPVSGQDSHMMGGLAQANCLIRFPEDSEELLEGSEVSVDLLNWND